MKVFIGTMVDVQHFGLGTESVDVFKNKEDAVEWMRETLVEYIEHNWKEGSDKEIALREIKACDVMKEDLDNPHGMEIYFSTRYAYINDSLYLDVFEKNLEERGIYGEEIVADRLINILSALFRERANSKTIDTSFIRNYKDRKGDEDFVKEFYRYLNISDFLDEIFSDEVIHDSYSIIEGEGVCLEGDEWDYLTDRVSSLGYTDLIKIYSGDEHFIKEYRDDLAKVYENNFGKTLFPKIKYTWVAESNDKSYEAKANCTFDTEKECYEDMRHSALVKMNWNTEYEDCDEYDTIGYEVVFSKRKIVHESYSGVYTYAIKEVFE